MSVVPNDTELVGQLAEEFLERYRRGEYPPVSEYAARYPELAAEIQELFPALVLMENVGPSHERPPAEPSPVDEPQGRVLGDFRIIREVGRGGMGVVYEAEQVSLGRRVALKVLPQSLLSNPKYAKRFDREARAAARLHHTNIVPVFGVGDQEGVHYYVMQFIHGLALDAVLVELKRLREAAAESGAGTARQAVTASLAARPLERVANRDAPVAHVAYSLYTGQFEKTVLGGDGGDSSSSLPETVNRLSAVVPPPDGTGLDKHSPDAQRLRPVGPGLDDTQRAHLADTAVSSQAFALPGQSDARSKVHSPQVYWQSIARLGQQVAEALQYAHTQGVIHRDIKPGNLLLDGRGCVWITDFGLAKANDQQDLTHTGDLLGTLRYMAPEQFDGQADARSDVYALGLTLYELLVLQPAFDETDRRKLIKQVTTGTPVRLRLLDPQIPRDLETIVHKAIERDPAHRYATAQDLADDLRRYLGDEPVRARRISPVQRFTRWCRRNPAGAAVVALLVIGLSGSITAAVLFAQERDRTNDALADSQEKSRQLTRQNDVLAQERRRADEERQRAETEQQRAEDNHRRAREAVDRLLTKVAQDLEDTPQMEQIRRALLEDALEFYQVFLKQKGRDSTIRYETGLASLRVADIERQLSRVPESLQHYDAATKIFQDLAAEYPTRAEYREQLAHCDLRRGTALARVNRYDDAVAAYEQALKSWEALASERPNHPPCLEELARANTELGSLWSHRFFGSKSFGYIRRADELLAQLAKDFPNYPVDPTVKLKVPDLLRATASNRREPPEAILRNRPLYFDLLPHEPQTLARMDQEGQELLKHWDQLVETYPDIPDYRKSFHKAALEYSHVLLAQDRLDEYERLTARMLIEINHLVATHPDVPEYQVGMMWNAYHIGSLFSFTGNHAAASEHFRLAIDTARQLADRFPNESRYFVHLAGMLDFCPATQFRDTNRSLTATQRAVQLDDTHWLWMDLAFSQMRAGLFSESLRSCQTSRERGGLGLAADFIEAHDHFHLGQFEAARSAWERATNALDTTANKYWYTLEVRLMRTEMEERFRQHERATANALNKASDPPPE